MRFGSCLSLVQWLQWDTGTPAGWTAPSSSSQVHSFWEYEEQISSAASTCCHLTSPDLWVGQNFTWGETDMGIQSASWANTFWTNRDTTSIPREFYKQWYDRSIYQVLSFFNQGLSHQLVAINDHNPPTKNTKGENVSIFLCKLNRKSRRVFRLNTESTSTLHRNNGLNKKQKKNTQQHKITKCRTKRHSLMAWNWYQSMLKGLQHKEASAPHLKLVINEAS